MYNKLQTNIMFLMNFAQLTRSFGVKSSTSHAGAMGCATLCGAVVGCIGSSQEADSWEKIQGENVEKMNVFQW